MNIVIVQLDITFGEQKINFDKVEKLLSQEIIPRNSLIVLPEMFYSGFDVKTSENIDGIDLKLDKTGVFLKNIAQKYNSYVQGSGITLSSRTKKRQNISVVYAPDGSEMVAYQKIHPFSYANENKYFDQGKKVVKIKINNFTLSPFICFDLRFPEVFRRATLMQSNLITIIANWPQARIEHWKSLLIARAIENQVYIVGVNRVGNDPWVQYSGESMVIAPTGEVLLHAGKTEGVFQQNISKRKLMEYREKFPVLDDLQTHWFNLD